MQCQHLQYFYRIADDYLEDGINWVLIIPEYTEVNLLELVNVIYHFDSDRPQFFGRALQDTKRVIIHHFAEPSLKYPDVSSGVLFSWPVFTANFTRNSLPQFNIDPKYEVSHISQAGSIYFHPIQLL